MHLHRDRKQLRGGELRTYVSVAHNVWSAATTAKKPGSTKKKLARPVVFARLGREDQLDLRAMTGMREVLDKLIAQIAARDGVAVPPAPAPVAPVLAAARTVRARESVLRMLCSREFGVRKIVECVWERLGLKAILSGFGDEHPLGFDFERVVFGMVLNRLVDPMSKRACNTWLQESAYFPEADGWGVHVFYRALDVLDKHADELSDALLEAVRRRLPKEELQLLLLDTTSSYFATELSDRDRNEIAADWAEHDEGEAAEPTALRPQVVNDPPLRERGHSKDHRPDRPQVVIGVLAGADGRLLAHKVYPGNRQDQRVTPDLVEEGRKVGGRLVYVMDSGMGGGPNLRTIDAIEPAVDRVSAVPLRNLKQAEEILRRPGRWAKHPSKPHVTLRDVAVAAGDGENARPERFIATRNAKSADRAARILGRSLATIEEQLAKDASVDDHGTPMCRILTKPSLKRLLRLSADGKRLMVDREAVDHEKRLAGVRVLRTTILDLPAAEVVAAYQSLLDLEDDFRTFKSVLQLRPMHHRAARRIKAHILIVVLALVVMQDLERLTGMRFDQARALVQGVKAAKMADGSREFWMRGEWTPEAEALLAKLGLRSGRRRWSAGGAGSGSNENPSEQEG